LRGLQVEPAPVAQNDSLRLQLRQQQHQRQGNRQQATAKTRAKGNGNDNDYDDGEGQGATREGEKNEGFFAALQNDNPVERLDVN